MEPDPELDLSGSDAALKLCVVANALWPNTVRFEDVTREHLRDLSPELVRQRQERGATTRLVARCDRDGNARVAYEEVALGSALATPHDRVVYTYELGGESTGAQRVHVGHGVGPIGTAKAVLYDLERLSARKGPIEGGGAV